MVSGGGGGGGEGRWRIMCRLVEGREEVENGGVRWGRWSGRKGRESGGHASGQGQT